MVKLITYENGRKVSEAELPEPAKPDVDAEIGELKARITALEAQVQVDRVKE